MSATSIRTIEVGEATVSGANYVDIVFNCHYTYDPIITANVRSHDINVYASNITGTTARLNFSIKFTGTVLYQVIERG